ncbi:hypothetical protein [Streptacidiphilus cavernicola]|uniref:Uncharacterized protein n=1 Tax=Streptacidiphilus cavernicola TaxID=3342716 RepID=A0ABV6W465_9ACTN
MDQHPYFSVATITILAVAGALIVVLFYLAAYLREKYLTAAVDRRAAERGERQNTILAERFDAFFAEGADTGPVEGGGRSLP